MTYPKANWSDKESHLLFDIGFTYGLLWNAERILKSLPDPNKETREILEAIESLRKGRLNIVNDIYDAARTLAEEGKLEASQ